MAASWIWTSEGDSFLSLKVIPKASRNGVVGVEAAELKIKVQAPPVEGAANEAVVQFLSKLLDRPKSSVDVIKGEKSRHKVVKIKGIPPAKILEVLKHYGVKGE
ncbi:MAG TPA: DUF167 domain-containing protein [bacterium]|nr:DUF167 domain-containing protein [bacterium]